MGKSDPTPWLARLARAGLLSALALLSLAATCAERPPAQVPAPAAPPRPPAPPTAGFSVESIALAGPREITNGTSATYEVRVQVLRAPGANGPLTADVRLEGEADHGHDAFSGLLARGKLVLAVGAVAGVARLTLSCVAVGDGPANTLRGNAGDSGHGAHVCPEPQPCPPGCLSCPANCDTPGNPPCPQGRQCCPSGCGQESCVDDPVTIYATLGPLTPKRSEGLPVLCVP